MSSLKPLRSVAHNLAHHFASTLNYWADDYAINHLAKAAKSANASVVVIDVLAQTILPSSMCVGVVAEFLPALKRSLEALLEKEGLGTVTLVEARMEYNFAAPRIALSPGLPTYDCVCRLETSEGRSYESHLSERNN